MIVSQIFGLVCRVVSSGELRHVTPYIGGVLFKEVRQGENELPYTYLDKATQKKAMRWILNQVRRWSRFASRVRCCSIYVPDKSF